MAAVARSAQSRLVLAAKMCTCVRAIAVLLAGVGVLLTGADAAQTLQAFKKPMPSHVRKSVASGH